MNAGSIRWAGAYGHYWWIDPIARLPLVLLTNTTFEGMAGTITVEVMSAVYRGD
jgi:CubicO group peptidase (beta-lactamase class C family)